MTALLQRWLRSVFGRESPCVCVSMCLLSVRLCVCTTRTAALCFGCVSKNARARAKIRDTEARERAQRFASFIRMTLQCVVGCCSMLQGQQVQHTATHCNTMQRMRRIPTTRRILQHSETRCNTLKHTAAHCNTLQRMRHMLTTRRILQHTATHCNTLQHTATHATHSES